MLNTILVAVATSISLLGQTADPRLTVADVEKATGLHGLQQVAPGSVTGAGAGLNFASAEKHMVLMVKFGTADLYQRAKAPAEVKVGDRTISVPVFHAAVAGLGDEAFDSPPGPMQYVLYVRKGNQAISVTTYIQAGKPILTMAQLKAVAAIAVSRI